MSEMQKPVLEHPTPKAQEEVLAALRARLAIKQSLEGLCLGELLCLDKPLPLDLSSHPK